MGISSFANLLCLVYGLEVEKVNTLNYQGKVKRNPMGGNLFAFLLWD